MNWLSFRGPDSGKLLLGKHNLIVVRAYLAMQWATTKSPLIGWSWRYPENAAVSSHSPSPFVFWFTNKSSNYSYALSELEKDVEKELLSYPESEREALRAATKFAIFVVHNKNKPKLAELPLDTPWAVDENLGCPALMRSVRYFAGANVEDLWCVSFSGLFFSCLPSRMIGWSILGRPCECPWLICDLESIDGDWFFFWQGHRRTRQASLSQQDHNSIEQCIHVWLSK